MVEIPSGLYFSKSHEWAKIDGDEATLGVSDFAQNELGDITYLELPEPGTTISQGEPLGVIESVKAANDIYSPISGTVEEINKAAVDDPSLLNRDAQEAGWLIKAKLSNPKELDGLLDAAAYEKLIGHH